MTAEPLKALRTRMAASLRRERLSPLATAGLAMLGAGLGDLRPLRGLGPA